MYREGNFLKYLLLSCYDKQQQTQVYFSDLHVSVWAGDFALLHASITGTNMMPFCMKDCFSTWLQAKEKKTWEMGFLPNIPNIWE